MVIDVSAKQEANPDVQAVNNSLEEMFNHLAASVDHLNAATGITSAITQSIDTGTNQGIEFLINFTGLLGVLDQAGKMIANATNIFGEVNTRIVKHYDISGSVRKGRE